MNCPRCEKYIAPEFYCINCGFVPPRAPTPDPNNIRDSTGPRETVKKKLEMCPDPLKGGLAVAVSLEFGLLPMVSVIFGLIARR